MFLAMRSCRPALSILDPSSVVGRKALLCWQWVSASIPRAEQGSAWGVHLCLTLFVRHLNGHRHIANRVTCGCQAATVGLGLALQWPAN